MRERLQLQGIVMILFGILLALVGIACGSILGPWAVLIVEIVALLIGIIGVALSLTKEDAKK